MKIEYINNYEYIAYLSKYYYNFNKDTLEDCIYKILKRLKKEYNVDIYSTFNIKCYINDNYGIILGIRKDNDPFLKYKDKPNLNIKYYNSMFLYEIDNYFIKDKLDCNIYRYDKKYYIDNININILEHINKIIFGDEVLKIINSN